MLITREVRFTIFLLSPANLAGQRAAIVFNPNATFALARQLRSADGARLGDVYSFVSGLYFRGKRAYAEAFGRPPPGLSGGLVISPCEGLRFLHEPVTLARLQSWADVSIDEGNPRFTQPLLSHAAALERAVGDSTRFVLLGSVATDKYVGPLTQVFGDRLLFPPVFAGRGDMSRGALMLRAAQARTELEYAPVQGSQLHGTRPTATRPARPPRPAPSPLVEPFHDVGPNFPDEIPELVIFVGLPGAGKSTFFRERLAATHLLVSKDALRGARRAKEQQEQLIERALGEGRSIVVDNTNVTVAERAQLIQAARRWGARVVGFYFDAPPRECMMRNRAREGRARVPDAGFFAIAKRLVRPDPSEGFDELHEVRTLSGRGFEVASDGPASA